MNQKIYKLNINKPCGQEWDSMSQHDIGRYCLLCSKNVSDLTHLSDHEIINKISQSSGKLCGRLTQHQLNRKIIYPRKIHGQTKFSSLLAGILLIGSSNKTSASSMSVPTENVIVEHKTRDWSQKIEITKKHVADSSKNTVHGFVYDKYTKEPLPFVSVLIHNTKTETTTDLDGKFTLVIPDSLLADKIKVAVSYIGYETTELIINKKTFFLKKEVLLCPMEQVILGEVEIVIKKKWWQTKQSR